MDNLSKWRDFNVKTTLVSYLGPNFDKIKEEWGWKF